MCFGPATMLGTLNTLLLELPTMGSGAATMGSEFFPMGREANSSAVNLFHNGCEIFLIERRQGP